MKSQNMDEGKELSGQIGFQILMLQSEAYESARLALDHLDITPARASALLLVRANPGCTQTALGEALHVNRSSAMKIVDILQTRGVVHRAPSSDPRAHALELTEAGAALAEEVDAVLARHERRFFGALSEAERAMLLSLLLRLRRKKRAG
ncbi:MarR family winged helix-turn-helix transcriptional regulator [Novosphingobium terrae]|uniref:MarR family winged helix-turn-helix transcriptional regulator n=1 Tax=Novosphingobium terrae TaxID=2726189 RepID=UPI00197D379B|nr:MarR family transcriptional regulator [Novosphingobium terrae]